MLRLIIFSGLLLSLIFPKIITAQENWKISNFSSEIEILTDGKVSIQETITADFGTVSKHGIFRKIPTDYVKESGGIRYIDIQVNSVLQDSEKTKYEIYDQGGYRVVKIGDPDRTVSGTHTYTIGYTAIGALNPFSDHDEFYWNSVGTSWEVTVEKASAVLKIPNGALETITCYSGPEGTTSPCISSQAADSANFTTNAALAPGSDLTFVASLKKGAVPVLVATKPASLRENRVLTTLGWVIAMLIFGSGALFIFQRWKSQGRDLWFRSRFLNDPNARAEVEPLFNKDTVVVEFEPPEKLRPAEIGTLMDQRADTLDVTATIIDLATRGYLKITELEKKWVFGSKDYLIEKLKEPSVELLSYEGELLKHLFDTGNSVHLSSLKNKFYSDLKKVKEKLYEDTTAKKLFASNPETVRTKYIITGIVLAVLGFFIFIGTNSFTLLLALPGMSVAILGILWAVFGSAMPRRTAYGHELYRRARGFEMFIERAEKYRQQFFEKKNLFNELLPYAIVFGATEKFAKAFKDMGIEPSQPSWYSGSHAFNAAVFGASLNNFSNSMSQAIASTPGGSGSSGFGGGGFSGGGGGGGGGGSW